jgi:hypothetical protein
MSELHRNSPAEGEDERLGFVHENLEGWIPAVSTESEIRAALEKAFDYRGDLTITLKSGQTIEGYLFDRKIKGPSLSECFVRLMLKDGGEKISIAYSDVAGLAFTGRDTAAGKSFAAWVKKYNEKKAAGEKNVGLEPEPLD